MRKTPDVNLGPAVDEEEPAIELKGMDSLGHGKWRFKFELTTEQGEVFSLATEAAGSAADLSKGVEHAYRGVAQRLGDLAVLAEKTAEDLAAARK